MPTLALPDVPPGTDIYIDANIFVYAMLNASPECDAFLARCGSDIFGYSDARSLHDCIHQLMLADAENVSGSASMRRPRDLKRNPSLISQLKHWQNLASLVLQLPVDWIDVTRMDISQVPTAATSHGLLCGDALLTVLMQSYGITEIASRDADFARTGLTVYVPGDI